MLECAFCGNANVEKITDEHYNCSICGFGWNGKQPANMSKHLQRIINLTKYLIVQNPTKSRDEITNIVMEKLHAIENHPVDKFGYCEYCNTRFE